MRPRIVWIAASALVAAGLWTARVALPRRDLTTSSEDAYRLYSLGWSHWTEFRWESADSAWGAATELDPRFAMAWTRRADVALLRLQKPLAVRYITRAEELLPGVSEVERYHIRWTRAAIDGDHARQRLLIEEYLDRYPDDPDAWFNLSEILVQEGEVERGVECLEKMIEIKPTSILAYNNLGYGLADLGRYDEALEALRKYAFVNTDEPNPHDSLGELYERIGRYDDAEAEYRRALEADPAFTWARVHLGRLYSTLGRHREALLATRADTAATPRSAAEVDLGIRTIVSLVCAGRGPEALAAVEGMKGDFMEPDRYLLFRAEALALCERNHELRTIRDTLEVHLERIPAGEPTPLAVDFRATWVSYLTLEAEGRWKEAADRLHAYRDRHHQTWDMGELFLRREARALVALGDYPVALERTEQLLAVNPRQPDALFCKASALDALGRRAEAEAVWRSYLKVMRGADEGHAEAEAARRRVTAA